MKTKKRQRATIYFNLNGKQVGSYGTFNDNNDYLLLKEKFNFEGNFPIVFIKYDDIKYIENSTGLTLKI